MNKKIYVFIIFLISLLTYSNTLFMDFISDDVPAIVLNDFIKNYKNIPSFFLSGIPHTKPVHYRPLVYTSLAVDYFFWGLNPLGFHLTNILFHSANSILFFLILLKITQHNLLISFLTTSLFSVYPIHPDLVAWIMARADLFCAFFMLLSFNFYLKYKEIKKINFLILSITTFIFSLLSKEIAVMLILIIIVYELIFIEKQEREIFRLFFLFLIPITLFLIARANFLPQFIILNHPIETRIFSSLTFIKTYFRLLILPINLKVLYHGIPIYETFFNSEVIFSFIILTIVTISFIILGKKNKIFLFGYLWLIINLFPVSGLPKIIEISPIAERYLYIPSFGFFIIVSQIFLILLNNYFSIYKKIVVILIIIIFFLGIVTFNRNFYWKDNLTFLKKMTIDSPNYSEARKILANLYLKIGEYALAESELRKLIELTPEDEDAYNDLGNVYVILGKIDEAEEMFKSALKINPNYHLTAYNLANIYAYKEKFDEAEKLLLKIISSGSAEPFVYKRLGLLYLVTGKIKLAEEKLAIALSLDPEDEETKNYLKSIKNIK